MHRHGIAHYDDLYARSVADIPWFWDAVLRDELTWEWRRPPYHAVLDLQDGPAWPRWFVGARTNCVDNALHRHSRGATIWR